MKKIITLFLASLMALSFVSCSFPEVDNSSSEDSASGNSQQISSSGEESSSDENSSSGEIIEEVKTVLQAIEEAINFAARAKVSMQNMGEGINELLASLFADSIEGMNAQENSSQNKLLRKIIAVSDEELYEKYHQLHEFESRAIVSMVKHELDSVEGYLSNNLEKFQQLETILKDSPDGARIEIKDNLGQVKEYYRKDGDRYYVGRAMYVEYLGGEWIVDENGELNESLKTDIAYYIETGYWMENGSLYIGDMQKYIWTDEYRDHPLSDANTYGDWEDYVALPTVITQKEDMITIEESSYIVESDTYTVKNYITVVEDEDAFYVQWAGTQLTEDGSWITEEECMINGEVDYNLHAKMMEEWSDFVVSRMYTQFWGNDIYLHAKIEKESGNGALKMYRNWRDTAHSPYPTNWMDVEDFDLQAKFEEIAEYEPGDSKLYYLCSIEFKD